MENLIGEKSNQHMQLENIIKLTAALVSIFSPGLPSPAKGPLFRFEQCSLEDHHCHQYHHHQYHNYHKIIIISDLGNIEQIFGNPLSGETATLGE